MNRFLSSTCIAFGVAGALLAFGCQTKTTTAKAEPAQAQASMGLLNSKCPLMPSHPIDKSVTVDYSGGKVGLCCKGCIKGWNALSDEQKATALAKSK